MGTETIRLAELIHGRKLDPVANNLTSLPTRLFQ